MSSTATAGIGTKFRRWSGTHWVNIANITNIAGPNKTRETIDVTSLDSTAGYKEFIGGFRDGGTVALSMNFTRAGYDTMNTDFESDTIQNYEIHLADTEDSSFEFEGLVTELGLAVTVGDAIKSDVTIKINGQIQTDSGSSLNIT